MISSDAIGLLFAAKFEGDSAKKDSAQLKDAINKDVADIEKTGTGATGKVSGGFDAVSDKAKVAGAAIASVAATAVGVGAAFFSLAKNAADAGTEISRFSTLTGFSVETVGSLKIASEQAGLSLENIEEVYESFIELLVDGSKGVEDATEKLVKLGIDPQQGAKDVEKSFAQVVKTVGSMPDQASKAAAAMSGFGESGLSMIKVVDAMGGDLTAFTAKMKENGVVMDADGIRKAKEFDKQYKELGSQIQGTANIFATEFMPELTSGMGDLTKYFANNKEEVKSWGNSTANVLRGIIETVKELSAEISKMPQLVIDGEDRSWWSFAAGPTLELLRQKGKTARQQDPPVTPDAPSKEATDNKFLTDQTKQREDSEKARQAAEKAAREQQQAVDKLIASQKEKTQQAFEELSNLTKKNYEERLISGQKYLEDVLANERKYREILVQLVSNDSDNQIAREKNKTAREALQNNQVVALEKITIESNQRIAEANKFVEDSEKKVTDTQTQETEKRVRISEEEAARKIAIQKSETQTALAERALALKNGQITEAAYTKAVISLRAEALDFEKQQLLALTQTIEVQQRIKLLDGEIARQRIENAIEAIDAINKETEALEKRRRADQDFYDAQNAKKKNSRDPLKKREPEDGGVIGDIFGEAGIEDATAGITNQAEKIKAVYDDLAASSKAAIGSMVQGLGQLAAQWLSTGQFSAKAALQMVSGIAAGLAIEAGLKALMQLAEGLAAAANPFTAPLAFGHFAAAKAYGVAAAAAGAVAVGSGLAARAFGGSSAASGAARENSGAYGSAGSGSGNGNRSGNSQPQAYSGAGNDTRIVENGINTPFQLHRHEIDLVGESRRESMTIEVIKRNVGNNGDLRDLFRKIADDSA